jgi:hypothetical protein
MKTIQGYYIIMPEDLHWRAIRDMSIQVLQWEAFGQ